MDPTEIARWQFAITTVYHFLFVPVTIGLSAVVAGYQTAWLRSGHERWLRLTRFFGSVFLVNFALGVVTGIVQEFQFGMAWSDYSRFVGDVFGAPLAVEGLLAFFLESTFLGLWIFGWDRLPRRVHLACIWLVHLGTLASAYFILAANSWMQHPVGYRFDPATGRAEMDDFAAVLLNPVQVVTFPHVVLAAYMTAGAVVAAVGAWHLRRLRVGTTGTEESERTREEPVYRTALRTGAAVVLVAGVGVVVTGDLQARVMTDVQPMKMAAAEALYDTESSADFSLLTVGTLDGDRERFAVTVPSLLSFLATGTTDGEVEGINQLREQYRREYGQDPATVSYAAGGDYAPDIPVSYWTFRLMMGTGGLAALGAAWLLWASRRGRAPTGRVAVAAALALPLLPLAANSLGWIFTEVGRQPWAVFGLMTTANGVSPTMSAGEVLTSLVLLTAVYGVLAVVEVGLVLGLVRRGAPEVPPPSEGSGDDAGPPHDRPLAVAY